MELPPDVDTSTSSSGGGTENDEAVNDGRGKGAMIAVRLRENDSLASHALVMGAPDEAWEGATSSGQLSILIDSGSGGGTPGQVLAKPVNTPHTIVEDGHSAACDQDQAFALDLLPERKLGAALSFATHTFDVEDNKTANDILAGAAIAGSDSGRVLTYRGCQSCAILPKPDGVDSIMGGEFGTSVAVGYFAPDEERLAVGAPKLGGGKVVIVSDFDRGIQYPQSGTSRRDDQPDGAHVHHTGANTRRRGDW